MAQDDRALEIANDFSKFCNGGSKSLIEKYTLEQIESALPFCRKKFGGGGGWARKDWLFEAMKEKINELRQIENWKRTKREKWKDRGIGAIVTALVAALLWVLRELFC